MKTKISKFDKYAVPTIITLSILVPIIVLILMYLPERSNLLGVDVGTFPFFHAIINALTALLLIIGYRMILKQKRKQHQFFMMTAFALSVVFLVSYVISKISNDPVPHGGEGLLKGIYFFILITHIILSAIIVPLVLFTIYRAISGNFEKHKKIARWTFPIWLYVAITGVLVYLFMYPYY
ncbi:MAG: DUF420 domain-containing protein [Psychroflexus halocasei]